MGAFLDSILGQPEPQEQPKGSITSLLEKYPILKTIGLSTLLGLTAGGIGHLVKKTTGQGPGGLLPALAGVAAPIAIDVMGNSPLKRNFDRWGFPGLIKSKESLLASGRPNKDGYIRKGIYNNLLGIGNESNSLAYGDLGSKNYFRNRGISTELKRALEPMMTDEFDKIKQRIGVV